MYMWLRSENLLFPAVLTEVMLTGHLHIHSWRHTAYSTLPLWAGVNGADLPSAVSPPPRAILKKIVDSKARRKLNPCLLAHILGVSHPCLKEILLRPTWSERVTNKETFMLHVHVHVADVQCYSSMYMYHIQFVWPARSIAIPLSHPL